MASLSYIPSSSGNNNSGSTSTSQSSSEPYAPEYIQKAGDQIGDFVGSAKSAASAQTQRLMDFIASLHGLRSQVMNQAKGAAARGANGQQNPLAVYQAVNEMANQAGIPLTANIQQALMQGNSIENTLNTMLSQAAQHYSQLASIQRSNSSSNSNSGGGGQVINLGGGRSESKGKEKGTYTDIYGNISSSAPARESLDQYIERQNREKQQREANKSDAAQSSGGFGAQGKSGSGQFDQSNPIPYNKQGPTNFSGSNDPYDFHSMSYNPTGMGRKPEEGMVLDPFGANQPQGNQSIPGMDGGSFTPTGSPDFNSQDVRLSGDLDFLGSGASGSWDSPLTQRSNIPSYNFQNDSSFNDMSQSGSNMSRSEYSNIGYRTPEYNYSSYGGSDSPAYLGGNNNGGGSGNSSGYDDFFNYYE